MPRPKRQRKAIDPRRSNEIAARPASANLTKTSAKLLVKPTADIQRVRLIARAAAGHLDQRTLAANRKRADLLIERASVNRAKQRSPEIAARLQKVAQKREAVRSKLRAIVQARAKRTPEQIIESFLTRLQLNVGRTVDEPARLLLRGRFKTQEACETALAEALGLARNQFTQAGLSVHHIAAVGSIASFGLRFNVPHRTVRTELRNMAWALRKKQVFESVATTGLIGIMYAPSVSAATHAERTFAWHLQLTRTSMAHALLPAGPNGRPKGEGIVIAHPDTGWASHPQYDSRQIDAARSHDIINARTGGNAAKHSVRNGDAGRLNITHGTATGSVIIGGRPNDGEELSSTRSAAALAFGLTPLGTRNHVSSKKVTDPRGHLTGVAPRATVVPIKVISDHALEEIPEIGLPGIGVFRLFDEDFVRAIRYAIDVGAHAISISIGGLLHDEVRRALDDAILEHDIIVVAAAGQTYLANGFTAAVGAVSFTGIVADDSVVLPAAYTNVMAVAGCAPDGAPWVETHRGPNVDITAPADAIWVADFKPKDNNLSDGATRDPTLECASGTSFSAAFMAGTAALWLAHWGRDLLLARYRDNVSQPVPLAWVFRHQLQRTANAAHAGDWDDGDYGSGVVNVEALLNEPLPDPRDVQPPPAIVSGVISMLSESLGPDFAAAEDAFLDFMDFLGGLPNGAARAVEAGLVAAERAYENGMKALADGWALAETAAGQLVDDLQRDAEAARGELERLIDETASAGEEFLTDTAQQAEAAWESVEEGVEEFVDTVGEAGEGLIDWLTGG